MLSDWEQQSRLDEESNPTFLWLLSLVQITVFNTSKMSSDDNQAKNETKPSETTIQSGGKENDSTGKLTDFVLELLDQLQTRFQNMSDNIMTRVDEMGGRINELQQSVEELIQSSAMNQDSDQEDNPQPTK
eukprot:TRINITY_DN8611_c0_g1_i5.p3 TRINITY_DN8611_c0_g1~~TRINITY_DN8611_c0_g1_i5.p3  ORF type:complete len:140 (-),score=18.90 TRINITY_DN8611_c0_g1_i5:388-780(-)